MKNLFLLAVLLTVAGCNTSTVVYNDNQRFHDQISAAEQLFVWQSDYPAVAGLVDKAIEDGVITNSEYTLVKNSTEMFSRD